MHTMYIIILYAQKCILYANISRKFQKKKRSTPSVLPESKKILLSCASYFETSIYRKNYEICQLG